jgi:hypothetical protein
MVGNVRHVNENNWMTGVNFINVLRAAFAPVEPKSAKKTNNLTVFFALLGSTHVKAANKTGSQ